MADKIKFRGTKQPISFGVEKLTGFIVDATEETIEGEELEIEDDSLILQDGEAYYACFDVGENFGCVHFEERENVD